MGEIPSVLTYLLLAEHPAYFCILITRSQPFREDTGLSTSASLNDQTNETVPSYRRFRGVVVVGGGGDGWSLSLEGEIDGGVGDEK